MLHEIERRRVVDGWQPVGRKIGFTNRTIWPRYNVYRPMWSHVWDRTVADAPDGVASIDVSATHEPRIEPEIVFGLARTPASAEPGDLVAAIDWYAHGFEVVQSVYPGWKFTGAEAFAAQALHGVLRVGPRRPLAELGDPVTDLASATVELSESGRPVATGHGALVLDSPVLALGHLVAELAKVGRTLHAGDVVTTGTLTDAQPLHAGQHWTTRFDGVPLHGLSLTVTA